MARQKWRGLRDTFRKELVKLQEKRSGGGAEEISSKWQFFDNMLFVKDQFIPRKVTGNIPNNKIQEDSTYDETEESEPSELAHSDNEQSRTDREINLGIEIETPSVTQPTSSKRPLIETDSQQTSTSFKKMKSVKDTTMQKLLAIEEKKLSHLQKGSQQYQQQHNDDDYYFALSLVPYIRQLPTHRKLFIRTKFQELLLIEHETLSRSQYIPQPQQTHTQTAQTSRQYTPVPTPSPAYTCTSTDFSDESCQPINNFTSSTLMYNMDNGQRNPSQTATQFFSQFQSDN